MNTLKPAHGCGNAPSRFKINYTVNIELQLNFRFKLNHNIGQKMYFFPPQIARWTCKVFDSQKLQFLQIYEKMSSKL